MRFKVSAIGFTLYPWLLCSLPLPPPPRSRCRLNYGAAALSASHLLPCSSRSHRSHLVSVTDEPRRTRGYLQPFSRLSLTLTYTHILPAPRCSSSPHNPTAHNLVCKLILINHPERSQTHHPFKHLTHPTRPLPSPPLPPPCTAHRPHLSKLGSI